MHSKTERSKKAKLAVIGGGIAGSTAALHLAELGLDVTLIEKGSGLVSGPPICHLHAGGNLYREIDTQQCLELLQQSIDTVRLYPHTVNRRPTVIVVPYSDGGTPEELYERLITLQSAYRTLVDQDERNNVLGDPNEYYKFYGREELESLASLDQPKEPKTTDDWMIPFAKQADLDVIKFPVVAVQEHGWSVFRLAASATLALQSLPNCELRTNTEVVGLEESELGWRLELQTSNQTNQVIEVDYLINACGFETGQIDDIANKPRKRLVEFKAAYVTHWNECEEQWPEVIFHGPRGTPKGMAQLTPYPSGVFQLHGMTKDITLFDDGLVESCDLSSQPKLPLRLKRKIKQGWSKEIVSERSLRAIDHMSQFIPNYHSAVEFGEPLFGAQQIPGQDETLRAADVTFEGEHYARIEVVKGSSALEAATKLVEQWGLYDYQSRSIEEIHPTSVALTLNEVEVTAVRLAKERGYPESLAKYYGEQS